MVLPTVHGHIDAAAVDSIIRAVAAEAVMPRFRALAAHDIREKNPGDLVTIADEEAEDLLSERLPPLLPGSVAVGEEGAADNAATLELLAGDQPTWIIDPVDGTHNFANGIDCFGMIIALSRAGDIHAGWIHDPINGMTLFAAKGSGAWAVTDSGAQRLRLGPVPNMRDLRGYFGPRFRRRLDKRRAAGENDLPRPEERLKCVAREYMELAFGRRHFARYGGRLKPWDHAAGVLALRELGCVARSPIDGTEYRATTPKEAALLLAPDEASWQELADMASE